MEPVDRSTIWPYDERGEPGQFYYSRYGSPTVARAEARLGELDGGEALLFPSGSGAATALALSLLKPGDTVALAAPVVVDSTAATPVHLRPLEHGADFVLHSATKYLAGHDDALLGAVVCRDGAAAEELRTFRGCTGIVAAPDPAW